MPVDELRDTFLTSALTDPQRAELHASGSELAFAPGQLLFTEGEPADLLWILLEGSIELSRRSTTDTIVLATMSTPGQWAGGLRAWSDDDSGSYRATGHGVTAGRCLCVPSVELARLVDEWFPFGKHMIVGIYRTVRNIEAIGRQRDSLVALGSLAAGLAHEINNPAAAALRAVESLTATCDTMLSSLTQLAQLPISAEQYTRLDALRREAAGAEAPDSGGLAAADREEIVGQWLDERGVERAWHLAPVLASAGVDRDWCARVEDAVGRAALGPALQWTSDTLNATSLLGELRDTTTRIAGLVDSVKSYSQMDRASLQRVDVHEGLESTLMMLGHKLAGVEVVRAFAPELPTVEVYAGELNQVWTNLIDNAVDAMDGQGTLTVTTSRDGPDLVVEIRDTGHGMPAAVQARAFEPFFTTKDVGKGTGLGLDISRRIVVERHHGDISFTSDSTGTTARVRIPLGR